MTTISGQAAQSRENSRSSDGKFGHQPHDRADGIELGEDVTARASRREQLRAEVIQARAALDAVETRAIAEATEETTTRVRERYGETVAYLVVAHDEHRSEKYVQVLDEDGEDLYDRSSYAYHEDIAEPQRLLGVDLAGPRSVDDMGTADSIDVVDTSDGDEIIASLDLRQSR